jgi:2-oxoglutarate dehydrogenase E1 component
LERYLQLTNEDPRYFPTAEKLDRQHQDCNFQVVYPTTPANLFHIYRRQMHRQFRKPVAIFVSKQLLRHPLAKSPLSDFSGDSHFQWIIEDVPAPKEEIKRVVLISGQVFTALHKRRASLEDKTTAFIKVEQLHPFPWAQLRDALDSYPNAEDLVWCQEEPLNMGAWSFVQPRFTTLLKETIHNGKEVRYAGRDPSASVAAGSKSMHISEENAFLDDVFQSRTD